jgi:GDPmannose 4,6-dehydratase
MWMMLQHPEPDDYVIATGETHSVREFVEAAFGGAGMSIEWNGKDLDEQGIDVSSGKTVVKIDEEFFRPAEVDVLIGDPSKAKEKLGWKPRTAFPDLVRIMVEHDIAELS